MNLSAQKPPQTITSPSHWVEDLYARLGQFYTQGMPEETSALRDGVFSDDDYVKQVALVQHDTRAMLDLALDRFDPGDATFVYLSDIDLQCHMLWRHADPKYPGASHPARDPAIAAAHAHDIEDYYEDVDAELGHVVRAAAGGHAPDRDERPRLPALHAQVLAERLAARPGLPGAEGRQAHGARRARATSTGRARAPTASGSTRSISIWRAASRRAA